MIEWVSGLNHYLATAILSMAPLVETSGSIPVALLVYHWPPVLAYFWTVAFNILPIPFIFWLLPHLTYLLGRFSPHLHQLVQNFYASKIRKHSSTFDKYGALALVIFLAIPGPGSGVWTAALLAWLFNIKKPYAYGGIIIGLLVAALVVTMLTLGGRAILTP